MNEKPFFTSITFWGAVIAAIAPLLALFGIEFPGGTEGLADQLATLGGVLLALYGRFRAKTVLTLT